MAEASNLNTLNAGTPGMSHDRDNEDKMAKIASRIMFFFSAIAENLDVVEVIEMNSILTKVIDLSKKRDDQTEEKINMLYSDFMMMVEFRSGISVHLIQQALRSFLMIEGDTEGLGEEVSDRFLELILTLYPSLATDVELEEESLKLYFKLLSRGNEKARQLRLLLVGSHGIRKAKLIRRQYSTH